jgi:REP element-mobilizing transposase RayT
MNRAIGRRTAFESRADARRFLAEVARAVRRGEVEVHAYVVMSTHFHLLVRSPAGRLSLALARIQKEYTRYFNRSRDRDGALFRGRYRSKWVGSYYYRRTLVRYIDQNPVAAGLATEAEGFPYGSAWHYARRRGPPWLERGWIEREVRGHAASSRYEPTDYGRVFRALSREGVLLVERRLQGRRNPVRDPLDRALAMNRLDPGSWMLQNALGADGMPPGAPIVDADSVLESVRELERAYPALRVFLSHKAKAGWDLVRAALLRELASLSYAEIGRRLGVSSQTAQRRHRSHRLALERDPAYRQACSAVASVLHARCRDAIASSS